MCFDLDSRPPVAPIAGAAVSHEALTLSSADGTPFRAFAAMPDGDSEVGVVVLPDVRGLYAFYEELALRFAERGMRAVAIDYFGRTAGAAERGEDFPYREHVDQTTPEGIRDDVAAAVAWLREQGATAVVTVGFCFGGRNSWLAAADGHGLAGAVGFYGMPGERAGRPGPIQRAGEIGAPILALMGGADQAIGLDQVQALDEALTGAGVEHEIVTYDGAPHSFFDRKQDEFAEASEDAWQRTLAFIERQSAR
jgi:carboxymethylenebutenolidase